MNKIYIRFGNFTKNDTNISCFEGLIEGNIVKIIMPTVLYTTCQSIARHIDEPAFIVVGDVVGKGKDGEPLLNNIKIKIPLTFDKKLETYTCDEIIPTRRKSPKNLNLPQWYYK